MKRTTIIVIVMLLAGFIIVPFGLFKLDKQYLPRTFKGMDGEIKTVSYSGVTHVNVSSDVYRNYIYVKLSQTDGDKAEVSYISGWEYYMTIDCVRDTLNVNVADIIEDKGVVLSPDTLEIKLPRSVGHCQSVNVPLYNVGLSGFECDSLIISTMRSLNLNDCRVRALQIGGQPRCVEMNNVTVENLYRTSTFNKQIRHTDCSIEREYVKMSDQNRKASVVIGDECDEVILLPSDEGELTVKISRPSRLVFDNK